MAVASLEAILVIYVIGQYMTIGQLHSSGRHYSRSLCSSMECTNSNHDPGSAVYGITQQCVIYFVRLQNIRSDFDRILQIMNQASGSFDCSTAAVQIRSNKPEFTIIDTANDRLIEPSCYWLNHNGIFLCKIRMLPKDVRHMSGHHCYLQTYKYSADSDSIQLNCTQINRKFKCDIKSGRCKAHAAFKGTIDTSLSTCIDEKHSTRKFLQQPSNNRSQATCLFALNVHNSNSNAHLLTDQNFTDTIINNIQLRIQQSKSVPLLYDGDALSLVLFMRRRQIEEKRLWKGASSNSALKITNLFYFCFVIAIYLCLFHILYVLFVRWNLRLYRRH
ncbi:unnamed protein product [Anisakis simplex]|uniref:Uncharacterized protein n=1 Tax=Anisakis simplex TaxID=6269 RepID=A0A0M3K2Y7_ANISI|nr:unnamed protein product [Anisakis simplex]